VLVASRILMGLGASLMAERPFYQPVVYSEHGGTVPSSSGVGVDSAKLSEETRVDTWLVAGVLSPVEEPASPGVVHFLQTTARQTQHSEMLALAPRSDRLQTALEYARNNLRKTLTVEMLADAVHVSASQLSRLFRQETGKSPAKAIEGLRLETARLMIEQSRLSLDAIARESGFRDRRHMREVFVRGYGIPPQSLRAGR
jgi:transcriptional regulator GlxA family with amidase domain